MLWGTPPGAHAASGKPVLLKTTYLLQITSSGPVLARQVHRTAHSTAVTTRPWAVAAVGLVSVGMTLFFFANLVYQGILAPMWTADSDEPGEWGSYES